MNNRPKEPAVFLVDAVLEGLTFQRAFEFTTSLSINECVQHLQQLSQEAASLSSDITRVVEVSHAESSTEISFAICEKRHIRQQNVIVAKIIGHLVTNPDTKVITVRGSLYSGNTSFLGLLAIITIGVIVATIYSYFSGGIAAAVRVLIPGLCVVAAFYWLVRSDRYRLLRLLEQELSS